MQKCPKPVTIHYSPGGLELARPAVTVRNQLQQKTWNAGSKNILTNIDERIERIHN